MPRRGRWRAGGALRALALSGACGALLTPELPGPRSAPARRRVVGQRVQDRAQLSWRQRLRRHRALDGEPTRCSCLPAGAGRRTTRAARRRHPPAHLPCCRRLLSRPPPAPRLLSSPQSALSSYYAVKSPGFWDDAYIFGVRQPPAGAWGALAQCAAAGTLRSAACAPPHRPSTLPSPPPRRPRRCPWAWATRR